MSSGLLAALGALTELAHAFIESRRIASFVRSELSVMQGFVTCGLSRVNGVAWWWRGSSSKEQAHNQGES